MSSSLALRITSNNEFRVVEKNNKDTVYGAIIPTGEKKYRFEPWHSRYINKTYSHQELLDIAAFIDFIKQSERVFTDERR